MSDPVAWQAREAAALEAAIQTRRHMRACRTCQDAGRLCAAGAELLTATDRAIRDLGDRFAARARAAAALRA